MVFYDWLLSLKTVFKFHPCCSIYQYFISVYGWIIFYYMHTTHFVYPFIIWHNWVVSTLGLLWIMLYEHPHANFCRDMCFHFFWVCILSGSYGNSMFSLLRNGWVVLHSNYSTSHSHQQSEGSTFSTSSPMLVSGSLFDSSHPGAFEVISWGFHLHFPSG